MNTCSSVVDLKKQLCLQEWRAGRHTGDSQESCKREALRYGCYVHVITREERWSLYMMRRCKRLIGSLSFSSTFFQHIDHFWGGFFSSQCSKNCLTFFTKPTWTDHLSRLCRRSMACNCIEWKFGASDFAFQRKPKKSAVVCLLNKLLFNKTAEMWIFPLERRCRFLS